MNKPIHSPHDRFFKQAMSDIRVARDFFTHHLPSFIKNRVDFDSLKFHKETFVDEELKLSAADVIYSAKIDEELAYFYLLVEQQTKPDKWLPFRLVQYILKLLAQYHASHPNQPLPLVYPCIFYNGKLQYEFSTSFFDLFDTNCFDMQSIFCNPFQLIDLMKIPDEESREYLWGGILEFTLKHRLAGDFMQIAEKTLKWLHSLEQHGGYNYAKAVIHYLVNQLDSQDINQFVTLAEENLSEKLGADTMTFQELAFRIGHQTIFTKLAERKFKVLPENFKTLIKEADEDTIVNWAERLQHAKSLNEVFEN